MQDTRRVFRSGGRAAIVAATLAVLVGAPREAHAQFVRRLYVEVDGTVGTMLSAPQSSDYGLGFGVAGRAGVRVAGPLGIHFVGAYHRWGEAGTRGLGPGSLTTLGGGFRLMPLISRSLGGPIVDLEASVALTGGNTLTRFHAGAGVGWLFNIGEWFALGPVVRGGAVFGTDVDNAVSRGTAFYWEAGLAFAIPHGRELPPLDTDGDGIMDPDDRCPSEAENRNNFEDTDGCPDDPDSDSDGVRDSVDRCPAQPETRNGFEDTDGCPDDPDTDADGVRDSADRCVREPEDRDNYQDEDGCPDPDNDGDTILDTADRCRDQPETVNNFEDTDGCPDTAPPAAVVVESRITINQRVQFEYNRAVLLPESSAILDAVVTTLRDHPEIRRMRVEGHADDQGSAGHNMSLSRSRARAVQRYLQQHGIARNRVDFEGFGSTRPITPGDTPEAHASNRRVEFVITDPVGGATSTTVTPAATPAAEEPAPGGRRRHRRHRRH
jgi:outer membrane protein OmpA-like peptidoglycan-associated protein